jgi:hypothetical protein
MYQLKPDGDNCVIVYNAAGDQVIKLEGGFSDVIIMTFANLSQQKDDDGDNLGRGNDYMAGVIAGIMHMSMLAPVVFPPLPEVPPIPPSV